MKTSSRKPWSHFQRIRQSYADNIIVLDDGVITEEGNHEALMQENGLYKAFVADREEASGWKV